MESQACEEPRLCRIPVVLLSLILILLTTILSVFEQFVVSDCDYVLALVIQCISWIVCFVGLFAFTLAIIKKYDLWLLPVLVVTIYGLVDSLAVFTIAIMSATGSESCVSLQVRAWNTTCASEILWTCDVFNNHVQNSHNGNLDEVIVEYSIIIAVYAAVLTTIYSLSFLSHFKVFRFFRNHRKEENKSGLCEIEEKKNEDTGVVSFNKDVIISYSGTNCEKHDSLDDSSPIFKM